MASYYTHTAESRAGTDAAPCGHPWHARRRGLHTGHRRGNPANAAAARL